MSAPGAPRTLTGSKANGGLWFGISTDGNCATVGNTTFPYVDIDTDADGVPEFEVIVENVPSTDLLTAFLIDDDSAALISVCGTPIPAQAPALILHVCMARAEREPRC